MERADIPFLSAAELSRLIQNKEVSPVDAVEAYLERIEQVDGKLNSYITVSREEAIETARQAERSITQGNYIGPMHGIPIAIKDQFDTKGILTTCGSTILSEFFPDEDSTVVANLKQAGAILLGKLNMSEFAMGDAFNHPYGRPRNPWDLERNPGTSSSGSSAATAAFLCATSVGEDTGGSVRLPASFCGLVGLRPSFGRVSRYGMWGSMWSMDIGGPISRTVEDCAITMTAIAGYDHRDPYCWDIPVPDYVQALDGNIKGVKVGVVKEMVYGDEAEQEVKEGVRNAVSDLEKLGASVDDVSIPLIVSSSVIYVGIAYAEVASSHYRWIRERPRDYDEGVYVRQLTGSVVPAQAYYKAQKLRTILRQQIMEALQKVDVLVLPTTASPATKIPSSRGFTSKEDVRASYFARRNFTAGFNLSGLPAISLPCGFTASEPTLPLGMQIAGRPFEEATVLKVAHAYEQSTSWHTRRPPI